MEILKEITRILTEFAGAKFSAQVLEVKGPIQEGQSYRWRIVSNRYREVTVVAATKKVLLGKPSLATLEIYGLGETRKLGPTLSDLQTFLGTAELTPVR